MAEGAVPREELIQEMMKAVPVQQGWHEAELRRAASSRRRTGTAQPRSRGGGDAYDLIRRAHSGQRQIAVGVLGRQLRSGKWTLDDGRISLSASDTAEAVPEVPPFDVNDDDSDEGDEGADRGPLRTSPTSPNGADAAAHETCDRCGQPCDYTVAHYITGDRWCSTCCRDADDAETAKR